MHQFIRRTAFVLVALAGAASTASAGYTQINPPKGEERHDEIFSFIYGGKFVASGVDYTNGTITAKRVEDENTSTSSPNALVGDAGTTDQFFNANYNYAEVDAKFAVNSQNFGYITGSTYTKVFDQTGWGYQVGENMTSSLQSANGQTIRFARNSTDDHWLMSSNPSDNSDHRDHMVTYQIIKNSPGTTLVAQPTARTYMLFFEDSPVGAQVADFDFNDLVVELQASATAAPVPEPVSLAMLPLAGLAFRRRRN